MRAITTAAVGLYCLVASLSADAATTQFHLSLVGPADDGVSVNYMLDWVADASAASSGVLFGTSADLTDAVTVSGKAAGTVEQSGGSFVSCWSALLAALTPGATVYYALAPNTSTSGLSFDALETQGVENFSIPEGEITWAVFGDMGAPMQGHAAAVSLPALKQSLVEGAYSGVLNIGDISYELVTANGENYMDELLDITSRVPMMTTVGNHEYQYALSPNLAVQNYERRFHGIEIGAGAASGSSSSEFYSFSSGRIHFAFINTEVYGDEAFVALQSDGTTWANDENARLEISAAQAAWLEYDLSRVDRSKTPFVVVCGHRPPFKTPDALSATGNRFATEILPLLSDYEVDLYLAGHEHTYLVFEASTFGDYNVPPIIISGSPGNNEYIREESELKIVDFTWKTLIPKYGYGYLTATEDELQWQWGTAATDATHDPESTMWELQDEVTFARKTSTATHDTEGSAVDEPVDIQDEWTAASSSGSSNATDGGHSGSGSGSPEAAAGSETSSSSDGSQSASNLAPPGSRPGPLFSAAVMFSSCAFAWAAVAS